MKNNGVILNFNFDAGSTLIHFIERQIKVPYRYDKTFEGFINLDGVNQLKKNTIFVRYLYNDNTMPSFEEFTKLAIKKNFFKEQTLGRGKLGCIRALDCKKLIEDTIPEKPWFLTKGEGLKIPPKLFPKDIYQSI